MAVEELQIVKPYHQTNRFSLYEGDCRSVLPVFAECSVDSIVCDPPYELGFMGKGWDRSGIAYDVSVWQECLRVLKPGGHLLAFGGSRTYHRLACAIEDAGFEIRDQIQWIYGSGFPKSLDVSKAIDAAAGAEREPGEAGRYADRRPNAPGESIFNGAGSPMSALVTLPVTDAAKRWQGWGTGLKPAHEPIVLARKPLIGTVVENVLQHGTGGLNIDGCRIELTDYDHEEYIPNRCGWKEGADYQQRQKTHWTSEGYRKSEESKAIINQQGRWPANVIHDGSGEALAGFPDDAGANGGYGQFEQHAWMRELSAQSIERSKGSAARFFYCAKADQADRNEGLEDLEPRRKVEVYGNGRNGATRFDPKMHTKEGVAARPLTRNPHPTVKPTDLMRYLCRLVTPPGGVVLDPFCGSGSTGKGAMLEGLRFIGIELNADYCQLAQRRIEAVTKQGLLFS